MILYKEEDFLQLSGIQHFAFCRRQWALAYIELQWQENVRTVEGKLMHLKAHDASAAEKRGDCIISRGMPVQSREFGISGECDIVEFHRGDEGISLTGRNGLYQVVPVEYKRGRPKVTDVDTLQLTAQVLCLEEMLCCQIPWGYLYYGETRRRTKVEMHEYYRRRYTPRVKWTKGCNACSLRDVCLPVLGKKKSAKAYMERTLAAKEEGES